MRSSIRSPETLKNLTPIQVKLYDDWKNRFWVIPSGRRSRKTIIGICKVRNHALRNSGGTYFHGAPTWRQAKQIFWKKLKMFYGDLIKDKSESELMIRLDNDAEIYVTGLDRPERVEGLGWDGCHITEMGKIKDNAFEESIRPALADKQGFAILDGVPKGRNHYYEKALMASDGALPKTELKKGAFYESKNYPGWCYYHWFSADVLNAEEIESARITMDDRTFRQEYLGSFESYEGLAYYSFSPKNFKQIDYNPKETVHIGMDFNLDPMTAVLCHVRSNDIYQFDEVFLEQSNTFEIRDHLLRRFSTANTIIYPDSTGKHGSSNARESDLDILRRAGFRVKARSSNPDVRDRVNAVNSKLSAAGTPHYFIDLKCKHTIEDFNRVECLKDGRLNKEQEEQKLKHITDALGYMIFNLYGRLIYGEAA